MMVTQKIDSHELSELFKAICLILRRQNKFLTSATLDEMRNKYDFIGEGNQSIIWSTCIPYNHIQNAIHDILNTSATSYGVPVHFIIDKISSELRSEKKVEVYETFLSFLASAEESNLQERIQNLKPGTCYLVPDDAHGKHSYMLFERMVGSEKRGLLISRRKKNAEHLINRYANIAYFKLTKKLATFFWMNEKIIDDAFATYGKDSNFDMPITRIIRRFANIDNRSIIILDGLCYLRITNGFEKLLRWTTEVSDIVMDSKALMLCPFQKGNLETNHLNQLMTNMDVLEIIPDDRLRSLGFIKSSSSFNKWTGPLRVDG